MFDPAIDLPNAVQVRFRNCEPVGSRRTCRPPPTGTDDDWLCLLQEGGTNYVDHTLQSSGWALGGSQPTDLDTPVRGDEQFWSYTKNNVNLIVTGSEVFYQRFMAATSVSKRLNVLSKDDRIALFQAVLYGNGGRK